jgi:hypothetical protein
VLGKPFEDMQVPNVPADLNTEDFMSNGVESPDSLACLLPQAVHDTVSELANKLLRYESFIYLFTHNHERVNQSQYVAPRKFPAR